jgi:hypothetical protein
VSFPRENAEPQIVKPAWISVRPGRAVELLPDKLLKDAAHLRRTSMHSAKSGFARSGNGAATALQPHEQTAATTRSRSSGSTPSIAAGVAVPQGDPQSRETLIIDPTFPDPLPHLRFG